MNRETMDYNNIMRYQVTFVIIILHVLFKIKF